ncbi:MAG: methyltransferase domain-containing protein [Alphaproteobacteria bacterium]|nr:methyltransferase domain-containing protein [Alphaproteobacteria bacterium]
MEQSSHEAHIHRNCPNCGAPAAAAERLTRYEVAEWPMCRCEACRLVFLEWVPRYEELHDDLAWTKQKKRETERRRRARPLMMWLDDHTRWRLGLLGDATVAGSLRAWAPAGPVLDIGCGTANSFVNLSDRFVPHGIEIDDAAAEVARTMIEPRGGKLVHADALTGLRSLAPAFFSGVVLWSYLEHEAEPLAVLREVRRVVRPDGVVIIKVPNFSCWNRVVTGRNWCGFRHPDHVQYFTPTTLGELAGRAGFRTTFRLYGRIPTNDNLFANLRPC